MKPKTVTIEVIYYVGFKAKYSYVKTRTCEIHL